MSTDPQITALEQRLARMEKRLDSLEAVSFRTARARLAVLEVLPGVAQPFGVEEVCDAVQTRDPGFGPQCVWTVRRALRQLAEKGEIEKVQESNGSVPTLYVRAGAGPVDIGQWKRPRRSLLRLTSIIRAVCAERGEVTVEDLDEWARTHFSRTRYALLSRVSWGKPLFDMLRKGELVRAGTRKRPPELSPLGNISYQPKPLTVYRQAKVVTESGRILTDHELAWQRFKAEMERESGNGNAPAQEHPWRASVGRPFERGHEHPNHSSAVMTDE